MFHKNEFECESFEEFYIEGSSVPGVRFSMKWTGYLSQYFLYTLSFSLSKLSWYIRKVTKKFLGYHNSSYEYWYFMPRACMTLPLRGLFTSWVAVI